MDEKHHAITIFQPFASLIAHGFKNFETRGWGTAYRGEIYIHAAGRPLRETLSTLPAESVSLINDFLALEEGNYPTGCLVARARLAECEYMTLKFMRSVGELERKTGYWRPGNYYWRLEDVERLDPPVPCRGSQRIWTIPDYVLK